MSVGTHFITELFGRKQDQLDDLEFLERVCVEAVEKSGAKILHVFFHKFAPQGVTGFLAVEQGHFSIHTWPEQGHAALDFFSCGDFVKAREALQAIDKALFVSGAPSEYYALNRGSRGSSNLPHNNPFPFHT